MKVFKDIIAGDELFSDSFPVKLIDDVVYEVESKMITKQEGNYDIGANPSEEGAGEDEGFDETKVTVDAIVDAFRLQQTTYDKSSYMAHIKTYMKNILDGIKAKNPERADTFQKNSAAFVKKVLGDFKNYEFFTGETMNTDAMVVLKNYKEDGITPLYYFFKDGLLEEKV